MLVEVGEHPLPGGSCHADFVLVVFTEQDPPADICWPVGQFVERNTPLWVHGPQGARFWNEVL